MSYEGRFRGTGNRACTISIFLLVHARQIPEINYFGDWTMERGSALRRALLP